MTDLWSHISGLQLFCGALDFPLRYADVLPDASVYRWNLQSLISEDVEMSLSGTGCCGERKTNWSS